MKKIISSILAIVMVALMLPLSVLTVGAATDNCYTLYLGSDKHSTEDLSGLVTADTIKWANSGKGIVSVSQSGVVTALKTGTEEIFAITDSKTTTFTITVEEWKVNSISIKANNSDKKYYAGDKLSQSDFTVTATYNDGDTKTLSSYEYTLSPADQLSVTDTTATATLVANKSISATCTIKVETPTVKSVSVKLSKYSFTAGEGLPIITATVTLTDNSTITTTSNFTVYLCNGDEATEISSSYKFTTADTGKTIKVAYQGVMSSASPGITVTASSSSDSSSDYVFTLNNTKPTKMSYKVGETFDPTGITVFYRKSDSSILTQTTYTVKSTTTFTSTSQNTATVTLLVKVGTDSYLEYTTTFTGITVTAETTTLNPTKITRVVMDEDAYAIGYTFDLQDIYYIKCDTYSGNLYATSFPNYSDEMILEVRKANGNSKSTSTKYTISESDIFTDEDDDDEIKLVNMRLTIGSVYYNFTVEVTEPKVAYYYDDDLIATYDSLTTALKYTASQDPDVDEDDFELDEDVEDDEHILLVLGADASVGRSAFDVEHNVVIDLNGNDLTFRSDSIDDFADEDYTITIKNTSENEATFTYSDKNIEITLSEGDSFKFEEGYDEEEVLPGVIEVELEVSTGGTVTGTPKASNNVITTGMGTEVKLTITPSTGYAISDVKVGTKSVIKTTSYKTTTTGATYTFNPKESVEVKITFVETVSAWKNPFKDVSSKASYYSAVEFVYTNELFQGVSSTEFKPNSTMTRAMFATVLARLAGVDVSRYKTSSFTDVSSSDTRLTTEMVQSIEWAYEMGIIEGYGDGTFGPHNEIRHQQMYLMMYRYTMFVEKLTAKTANLSSVSLSVADKDDVADWALTGVKFAQKNGILVTSSSNRITPADNALRHELAQLLEKYCINVLGWAE